MPKIKSCAFNHDTAYVDLIFDSGGVISIYTVEVENQIETGMAGRSKRDWLIFNEPLTYAQLVLSGEHLIHEQARDIAREFMMYD